MKDSILIAEDIVKKYGKFTALDKVNISVPRGSIYGLLGPNGAGKTTLMRIINQITAPDKGKLIFNGSPIRRENIKEIGYLPEERGLYKKMKVGEQALYLSQLKGMGYNDAFKQLKAWFIKLDILDWWNKKVEELSKGMAQKIQFIVTVVHNPKLLIFDEPFSGFDPINAALIRKEILLLKEQGTTIIFSTHRMESVEEICDQIALINNSKTILEGNITDIKNKYNDSTYEIKTNQGKLNKSNLFNILNQRENIFTICINDNYTKKQVIEEIINNIDIDIVGFNKKEPTMEEIFIKAVRNE